MAAMLDGQDCYGIQPAVAPEGRRHHRCYGIQAGWIVVATKPQAERYADANLQRQGYRTFLPLVPARRRDRVVRSLVHRVNAPLFPGYVFCWHRADDPWRPIRCTPGVRALVKCGSQLPYASAGAVEAVQAVVEQSAYSLPWSNSIAPGVAVEAVAGPFSGLQAVVLQVGRDMALISLMMFGELREILVDKDNLQAREL